MTPENHADPMYRLDKGGLHGKNPQRSRSTRRVPGNVPYVVDNLWEWVRPEHFPSRRHCVCASPKYGLALAFGGSSAGTVYRIEQLTGAKVAQIQEQDAKLHKDAKSLHKTLLSLLDTYSKNFLTSASMSEKAAIAALWMPCLSRDEVEALFKIEPLAGIREQLLASIWLWKDAKIVTLSESWPFPEGEIFFEANSWELHP